MGNIRNGFVVMSAAILFGCGGGYLGYGASGLDAADFDGSNDWIQLATLSGQTGTQKTGTLSFWVRFDGGDGALQYILRTAGVPSSAIAITRNVGNDLTFAIHTSSNGDVEFDSASTYTASATWYHFLASWDAGNSVAHLYVNDSSDITGATFTDGTIDSYANWTIGSDPSGSDKLNGALAEFYYSEEYIDFSVETNRRKFISAGGRPMYLGADGSTPTSSVPLIYLHLDEAETANNFALNATGNGDFTVNGALSTASTDPLD